MVFALAPQQDTIADEEAIAFLNFFLEVGNGFLPQMEECRIKLLSFINRIYSNQEMCRAVFSGIERNYHKTLSG